MNTTALVSVVVATHNRPDRLTELLDSLEDQRFDAGHFEVIVVDDASDDGRTPALLERRRATGRLDLTVIRRPRAQGPAHARNDGWRAARAPLVAFTDDDCVASPQWLAAGLREHRRSPNGLVQGRTAPRPDERHRDGPFSRTLTIESLGPYYETCNMFYPRALLEQFEGFDGDTYSMPGGEDTDLAWNAIKSGAPAVLARDALVFHAVDRIGPLGMLRFALHWSEHMEVYVRHPELRRLAFTKRLFWKGEHYLATRALFALAVPRRRRLIRRWLAWPYLKYLLWRSLKPQSAGPLVIPWLVLHDLVEMYAVARAGVRLRTPML